MTTEATLIKEISMNDLSNTLIGKNLGSKFDSYSVFHKRYRNDFEGYVEKSGIILGIDSDNLHILCRFNTGGSLFPSIHRDEWVSYKNFNQSTSDYIKRYHACENKKFILNVISSQMFEHFLCWYGHKYHGNCTNCYRAVDDVIDDWNGFVTKAKVSDKKFIINIFKEFNVRFFDEMPKDLINRIGTKKTLYK